MAAGGQMTQALNQVVILGGGTAGWLTACLLAAEHGASLDITLVESPDIPIINNGDVGRLNPVSYTHLTLPTNREV